MYFNFLVLHFEFPMLTRTTSATDLPGVYKVLTTNLAQSLPPGTVFRVNTGAPIPPGADAVIMVEDTDIKSTHKDSEGGDLEEAEIQTLAQIPKGENIRFPGSDVKAGDLVFSKDTILDGLGGDVGTLAFVGKKGVRAPRSIHRVHSHRPYATDPRRSQARCSNSEHRKRNCRLARWPKDFKRVLGWDLGHQSPFITNRP
jgi:hypothetical protein